MQATFGEESFMLIIDILLISGFVLSANKLPVLSKKVETILKARNIRFVEVCAKRFT